ncbi:MAG: site-specific integrase [Candidatus Omnitrophica bacterium]|nr:site-specific integrase [Candidatus Omnitrophota bacterium]
MQEMLLKFKEYLKEEGLSKESIRKAISHVGSLGMIRDSSALSKGMIIELINARKCSESTRNQIIWSVRNYLRFMCRTDICLPKEKHVHNRKICLITKEDLREILDRLYSSYQRWEVNWKNKLRIKSILIFMYELGLTVKEFLELRHEDFQMEHDQFSVVISTNGSRREFFLDKDTYAVWLDYYQFFGGHDNNAFDLNVRKFKRLFAKLRRLDALLGKEISPRSLRHSFAYNCLQKGKSVESISHLLGQNIKKTKRYLKAISLTVSKAADEEKQPKDKQE